MEEGRSLLSNIETHAHTDWENSQNHKKCFMVSNFPGKEHFGWATHKCERRWPKAKPTRNNDHAKVFFGFTKGFQIFQSMKTQVFCFDLSPQFCKHGIQNRLWSQPSISIGGPIFLKGLQTIPSPIPQSSDKSWQADLNEEIIKDQTFGMLQDQSGQVAKMEFDLQIGSSLPIMVWVSKRSVIYLVSHQKRNRSNVKNHASSPKFLPLDSSAGNHQMEFLLKQRLDLRESPFQQSFGLIASQAFHILFSHKHSFYF